MRKTEQLRQTYKGRMMIGQAAAFRVASELLFRGHVPSFPSVDTGCDILLDNGIRIQVRAKNLQAHRSYADGFYQFSTEKHDYKGKRVARNWELVVDFFIFWGINEDRYFIVPVSECTKNFAIQPNGKTKACVSVEAMRMLRDKGLTYQQIAEQLGVTDMTVIRNLRKPSKLNSPGGNRHLTQFEGRWELLDVNKVLNALEQSSKEIEVL